MKKIIIPVVCIIILVGAFVVWQKFQTPAEPQGLGNSVEKANLIRLTYPRPNQEIASPLVITGEARGYWFFEASFPVMLVDWDGRIIAQGIATAKEEWMTENFVPFEATLTFEVDPNVYSKRGALILQKDNPSGLPEHDDALEIPITYK
ncbi:MAG: Gmad2 immunoglobulin-like domain-containing protein [Minisyncoccia bacterium]